MKAKLAGVVCGVAFAAVLTQPAAAHDLSANGGCREGDNVIFAGPSDERDRSRDLTFCRTPDGRDYDNHVHKIHSGGGWTDTGCREGDTLILIGPGGPGSEADRNLDLGVCATPAGRYYDNRTTHDGGGGGGGWTDTGCREGDTLMLIGPGGPGSEADRNLDLGVCATPDGRYYDNRPPR